jgi:uncharacterized protein
MKLLLVLAVVFIGFWIWRSGRLARKSKARHAAEDATKAIEMVRCEVCGVHCAKSEAVLGRHGAYCSAQHRGQAES